MNKVDEGFRVSRHRIEGVIGAVLMAVWVVGSAIAVGLQNGVVV